MHPTHHVHISTEFMFVILLFILCVIALFAWMSWSKRQGSIRRKLLDQEHAERMERIRSGHDEQVARRVIANVASRPSVPVSGTGVAVSPRSTTSPRPASDAYDSAAVPAVAPAPVIVNAGASRGSDNGFLEGALLGGIAGSVMGSDRGHDTVIERTVSAPAPAPDPFVGSGSDAGSGGFSYSSGGDTGGGFDCGGGGFDSGGCDF
ncbi:hypothetical protein K6L44_08375 [Gluconacetobacter entanii]|uniref:hypothetical protein n=1 Tax=Gluconacetobacter entanii TaxID=108528 RepID=UPI001C932FC7|nr:hypothetical protein [Gluconacetobacter entanii]MBY4640000.1 hypothetical protein [Gluconacetobacter entanii]MCW4581232.1 hypothetical protein [Gluconacetobacter entanii]MCW4584492.1 hypothetical protein [Gluconacetobacter entanii]MCW4587844.1 hypothetical protein [Gluconacetobacter entanii]